MKHPWLTLFSNTKRHQQIVETNNVESNNEKVLENVLILIHVRTILSRACQMKQLTSKETIREWLSTIPVQGDSKALTHCSSGSICIASNPSIILRPSTPFSIPRSNRFVNFGISVNVVATISLPICLCGTPWSEQYLYKIFLPLTQRFAWNTFQIF